MPVDPFFLVLQEQENQGNQEASNPFEDEVVEPSENAGETTASESSLPESPPAEPDTNATVSVSLNENNSGADPALFDWFNPLYLIALAPIAFGIFLALTKRKKPPGDIRKRSKHRNQFREKPASSNPGFVKQSSSEPAVETEDVKVLVPESEYAEAGEFGDFGFDEDTQVSKVSYARTRPVDNTSPSVSDSPGQLMEDKKPESEPVSAAPPVTDEVDSFEDDDFELSDDEFDLSDQDLLDEDEFSSDSPQPIQPAANTNSEPVYTSYTQQSATPTVSTDSPIESTFQKNTNLASIAASTAGVALSAESREPETQDSEVQLELASLRETNELLRKQSTELQQKLADANLANAQIENDKLCELETEMATMVERLKSKESDCRGLSSDLESALAKLESSKQDIEDARQQVPSLAQQTWDDTAEKLESKLAALERHIKDKDQSNVDLQAQLDDSLAKLTATSSKIESAQSIVPESAKLEFANQLQERDSKLESLQQQLDSHEADTSQIKAELDEANAKLESVQNELVSARDEVPADIQNQWLLKQDKLQTQLDSTLAANQSLSDDLESVRSELAEYNESESNENALASSVDAQTAAGIAKKLAYKSEKLRKVKAKLREKIDSVKVLENRLVQAETEARQSSKLVQENDGLYDEITDLKAHAEKANTANQQLNLKLEIASGKISELEQKVTDLKSTTVESESLHAELSRAVAVQDQLNNEINSLKDSAATAESVFQQRLAKHGEEVLATLPKFDTTDFDQQITTLKSENLKLTGEVSEAIRDADTKRQKLIKLENQAVESNLEFQKLNDVVQSQVSQIDELKSQLKTASAVPRAAAKKKTVKKAVKKKTARKAASKSKVTKKKSSAKKKSPKK